MVAALVFDITRVSANPTGLIANDRLKFGSVHDLREVARVITRVVTRGWQVDDHPHPASPPGFLLGIPREAEAHTKALSLLPRYCPSSITGDEKFTLK
jgi:hypothetical protein